MRGAERGCGSHSCSACKTFNALRAGFWSTACFLFPRPAEGLSQPLQRNRWSSRSVGHYSRASGRMGSTRPMKSGGGFIHGGFKAAALVNRSPPRPGLTRSRTTLDASCATPYSSAHSLAHSSSGHSLAFSSSSHSLAPSASSHSLASPSMTELTPSPSTRSLASSSAYSSQSSATLSRSSSNLSLGWREFRARRKPFAVLYDGQKAQSRGGIGEGLLPALRHHVLGEKKARAVQNTKESTKESSSRSTKDSVLAREEGVAARTFTKAATKAPPSDAKDHKDAKGSFLSSIAKTKLKGRRDDLRRFTTSVLPAHLLGLAKHAAARNSSSSSNNNNSTTTNNNNNNKNKAGAGPAPPPVKSGAQHLPKKVQRLDDAGREASAAMGPPRVYHRSVSHSAMASSREGGHCRQGTHMNQSHENVSSAGLAGAHGTPTSGVAPPKPPRTYASEGATTPRGGPGEQFRKPATPPRVIVEAPEEGAVRSATSPPPAKRSFVPLGTSQSCSALIKPKPAPRTVFPTFTTPIAGFRHPRPRPLRRQHDTPLQESLPQMSSTPLVLPRNPSNREAPRSLGLGTDSADVTPTPSSETICNDDSFLDDSYMSHKCYLSPSSVYDSSLGSYNGPPGGQDHIPWITTPPHNAIKASQSLGNLHLADGDGGGLLRGPGRLQAAHEGASFSHRMLLSYRNKENEVDGGVEKKWTRSSSLRRTFHHSSHNSGHQQDPSAHSDTEIGKISAPHSLLDGDCGSVGGSVSSERGIDVGRVGAWATSFEKLLEDPAGLHTFAEFLKKEYSHENIYFWTACERYKRLSNPDELRAMAKEIFERHLCIGASEPVNVDSQARQDAQDGLHSPNEFLFAQAQKQIFNLMKFDSYSRFLKSNLYKDCVSRDIRGQTLPYPGDETLDPDLRIVQEDSHVKLKKSKSDADERRRKSLLPWHRKDRSKSKDRGEAEYRRRKKMGQRNPSESSSVRSDMSGSRTSLNSSDIALGRRAVSKESLTSGELGSLSGSEGCNRCRVILPDLSNSVVAVRPGESIQGLLTRLLERRGISYSTFDVYQHKSDKLMEKTEDSSVLGGLEVRLEQRILFRLDLPNRKTVCVKAKPNKLANEVLKPILHKYGYKLDLMTIHKVGEEKGVNLKCHVNELDGDRLVVQTKEEVKEWGVEPARQKKRGSLDEITNRVFEDLLNGKSEQNFDELGVLDFDARSSRTDRSSDRSSSILGGFSRRNSLAPDKESNKKPRKPNSRSSVHENLGVRGMMPPPEHAIVTKRRGNNPANAKQENDELYEGLKRAQRSRLDDQRGTEINFELPDFLKCDQPQDKENQHAHLADQLLAHLECSFSEGGVIPSHQEAEDYFSMAHPEVWGGIPASSGPHSANATLLAPDIDLDDFDDTLQGDESLCQVPMPDTTSSSLHMDAPDFSPPPPIPMENSTVSAVSRMPPPSLLLSPPPLPPKPKLGGTRGPPPRPPSRQLHLLNPPTFSSTSDDDALHSNDAPIHITRQSHDKFNISFV
nr:uncharacterized protein LOC113821163 isoform X2 [Penaeus vannamei]